MELWHIKMKPETPNIDGDGNDRLMMENDRQNVHTRPHETVSRAMFGKQMNSSENHNIYSTNNYMILPFPCSNNQRHIITR